MVIAVQIEVIKEHAKDAIYKLNNPTQQIKSYVTNVVRAKVPKLTLDQVFASRDEIALHIKEELRNNMKEFGYFVKQPKEGLSL